MGYECLLVHDITFFVILLLGIFKGFESEVILKSYISGFPHLSFMSINDEGWGAPTMSIDWKSGIKLLRNNFRKQGLPQYWHKNSPHTYEVWQHGIMLVFYRRYCDSYTEFVEWLPNTKLPDYLGLNDIPDEGTLCKEEKRLKKYLEEVAI